MAWSFVKKRKVLGMDMGSAGVKLVAIQSDGPKAAASQWYYAGSFTATNRDKEIPAFKGFLRKNSLIGSQVACNLEEASLKSRKIDLPQMPESDLKEAIRWQMRDVVEGDIADYIVRHVVLGEAPGEGKKFSYLAYAVKKSSIQKMRDFLKKLSLLPILMEPSAVSLTVTFDRLREWKKDEFYGIINFGESQSVFSVMEDKRLYFTRTLGGISGYEMSLVLERDLGLKAEEAVKLKRQILGQVESNAAVQDGTKDLLEKADPLLHAFDTRIAIETQKSIDSFTLSFKKDKIHKLYICGGLSTLPGACESLSKNVGVPTELLDPSQKFKMEKGSPHLYDVALGLALYSA